jgi:hypothetical protein
MSDLKRSAKNIKYSMELQRFIRQSLVEIMKGIEEAQNDLKGKSHSRICPRLSDGITPHGHDTLLGTSTEAKRPIHLIEYDVAVEVSDKGGEGSVSGSASIGILNVKTGGKSASRDLKDAARLKFSIPVSYPEIHGDPAKS